MTGEAPAFLIALEESGFALAIRQSLWMYPLANVAHVVSLALFAAAVAVMDLRILGAFSATVPSGVIRPAQRCAVLAFALQALTGSVLFAAEASHVALNTVFQVKIALITLGLANAALAQRPLLCALAETPAFKPLPLALRVSAGVSLVTWILVAAAGRLIAYF